MNQKIRIKLKSFDHTLVDKSAEKIVKAVKATGAVVSGPIPLPTKIEKLTVSEAVMRMDLQNLPTLLFINAQSGRINVVYHRQDGNISWIDPEI